MRLLYYSFFIIIMFSHILYADIYTISSDCLNLRDIMGEEYPDREVMCGFRAGDQKSISSAIVNNILKKEGLAVVEKAKVYIIKRDGLQIDRDFLMSELESIYYDYFPGKEVRIEGLKVNKTIYIDDASSYYIDISNKKLGNVVAFVVVDNHKYPIQYSARIFDDVFIAVDNINKGMSVDGRVEYVKADVTNLKGRILQDISNVEATSNIRQGQVIVTSMVKSKVDKHKGDKVVLEYSSGFVSIEATGVVESNAEIGKDFLVKNLDSGIVVRAIYKGNNRAVVY